MIPLALAAFDQTSLRSEYGPGPGSDYQLTGASLKQHIQPFSYRLGDGDSPDPVDGLGGVVRLTPDNGMLNLDVVGVDVAPSWFLRSNAARRSLITLPRKHRTGCHAVPGHKHG